MAESLRRTAHWLDLPARLNHVIVLNDLHLSCILAFCFHYFNKSRPHLALDGNAPNPHEVGPTDHGQVIALLHAGGLHHRCTRVAT